MPVHESLEVVQFPSPYGEDRWTLYYFVVRVCTDPVTGRRWAFQDLRPFYTDTGDKT